MIFTEKSAFQAENRDLWKITKNAKTHCQIVRFGSFSDMLVLTTIRIKISVKFFIKADFCQFWPKIGDFSLKNKKFKNLTKIFILMVVRTNISENEPNRTIWRWVFAFFVIFHKWRFSARNADFSVKIIHTSLNFYFFAFLPIIVKSTY